LLAALPIVSHGKEGSMSTLALHRAHELKTTHCRLPYLVYEPPGWTEAPRPFLLFLHGSGERGGPIENVCRHGIPKLIEHGKNLPFVAISPHCPASRAWVDLTQDLSELLDHVLPTLHVDDRRLYLTGLSMGGFGSRQPLRLASLRWLPSAAEATQAGHGSYATSRPGLSTGPKTTSSRSLTPKRCTTP
jgi:poly(3-hydroxybutyrate) depolymerase